MASQPAAREDVFSHDGTYGPREVNSPLMVYGCHLWTAPSRDAGPRIIGSARNQSAKALGYVELQFTVYDRDGTVVESTIANVLNLPPGREWKFDVPVLADGAAKVKVARVVCR